MPEGVGEAARWYLVLTVMGAAALLPSLALFGRLWSGGVLFARPLGLVAVTFIAWFTSILLGLPYGVPLLLVALLALVAWSAVLTVRARPLLGALRMRLRVLAAGEVLALALFVLVLLARAQAPAATATEKPMDLMLFNTVRVAEAMPPADAWYGGEPLHYYYFGHLAMDAVGRLAGNPPSIVFNLSVAAVGAMAGAAAFAVAADLATLGGRARRRATAWVAGAMGVLGVILLAPIVGAIDLAAANGLGGERTWGWIGVEGLPSPPATTWGVPDTWLWWWKATRVVPGTISEFPAFSLILGDPHAHLFALPLGFVAIGLALLAFEGSRPLTWRRWLRDPGSLALAALIPAGLMMTNSWDAISYGALWALAGYAAFHRAGWGAITSLIGVARYLAAPVALAALFALPFVAGISRPGTAVSPVQEYSDPVRLSAIFLPLGLPLLAAAWLLRPRVPWPLAGTLAALLLVPVAAWAFLVASEGAAGAIVDRGSGWVTVALLVAGGAVALAAAFEAYRQSETPLAAWLGLAGAALVLLLATELFFVEDALGGQRLNTVFKFWYHVWAMLAVAAAGALASIVDTGLLARAAREPWRTVEAAAIGIGALVWVASLLYAPAMAVSRGREGQASGLDALAYLQQADPGLDIAIRWSRAELEPDRHVLLQAVLPSYQGGSLLAAGSGVPTLVGWPGHQVQWRGTGGEVAARMQAAQRIYEEGASEAGRETAAAWGVTHVYVGRQERAQYGPDVADRFAGWDVAFEALNGRIFVVPGSTGASATPPSAGAGE